MQFKPKNPNIEKLKLIGLAITVTILVAICISSLLNSSSSGNQLKLGSDVKIEKLPLNADGSIPISTFEPLDLNGLSQKSILSLREQAVNKYAFLVGGRYSPSHHLFSGIDDQLPWMSVNNKYIYGYNQENQSGPSNESRFILNPFLLLGADFWGVSVHAKSGIKWKFPEVEEALAADKDFKPYCKPEAIRYYPAQKRIEVAYNLSSFIYDISSLIEGEIPTTQYFFLLNNYNALDFGYKFLQIDKAKSTNIIVKKEKDGVLTLREKIKPYQGKICGKFQKCNSGSSATKGLDYIKIADMLPAYLSIKLWKERPIDGQVADLEYNISIN